MFWCFDPHDRNSAIAKWYMGKPPISFGFSICRVIHYRAEQGDHYFFFFKAEQEFNTTSKYESFRPNLNCMCILLHLINLLFLGVKPPKQFNASSGYLTFLSPVTVLDQLLSMQNKTHSLHAVTNIYTTIQTTKVFAVS